VDSFAEQDPPSAFQLDHQGLCGNLGTFRPGSLQPAKVQNQPCQIKTFDLARIVVPKSNPKKKSKKTP